MAHNIYKDMFGKDCIVTGMDTPAWHSLGKTVTGCMTWEEAIKEAGLDWIVEKQPLFSETGVELDAWGIFRQSDTAFLGPVGARYEPIQNKESFAFVDALIGREGGAHYDTAGALGNGEVIFCSAHLPTAGFEIVPGDRSENYLLFKTAHDGSLSATCKLTSVRVVCQNTLNQALRNGHTGDLKIKHTKNAQERMNTAIRLIATGEKTAEALRDQMRSLAEKRVTKDTMETVMQRLFPTKEGEDISTKVKNNIKDILNLYDYNDDNAFPQIRGTAYNLLNAVVEYTDKLRTAKGGGTEGIATARAESALFGSGEKFKSDAMEIIYNVAATMPAMDAAFISLPSTTTTTATTTTTTTAPAPAPGKSGFTPGLESLIDAWANYQA